jgi:hypothetical protein
MKSLSWTVIRFGVKSMIQQGGLEAVLDTHKKLAGRYSAKEGRKYASAQEEIDDMVKNIPELEPIKAELLELCQSNRKRVGLPE